jgi:hypothetical protein
MEKRVRIIPIAVAKNADIHYWQQASKEEKLDTLQYLRELYYQFNHENRKGFQRIYRIVKHP